MIFLDLIILPSGSYRQSQMAPVTVNGLKCLGNEVSIADCYFEPVGSSTCSGEMASLVCSAGLFCTVHM